MSHALTNGGLMNLSDTEYQARLQQIMDSQKLLCQTTE